MDLLLSEGASTLDFRCLVRFATHSVARLTRQDSNPHRHLRELLSTIRLSAGYQLGDGFTVIVHRGDNTYNYL